MVITPSTARHSVGPIRRLCATRIECSGASISHLPLNQFSPSSTGAGASPSTRTTCPAFGAASGHGVVALGSGTTSIGMGNGFWPLFNHIKKRDIAMTSPVEMDYRGMTTDDGKLSDDQGAWTMSFLYRETKQGPEGDAERGVKVVDNPEVTVISIGMMGGYGLNRVNQGVEKLREVLAKQDRWVAAGDPRSLSYNGPQIAFKRRWSEIQIPVKPRNAIATSNPGSTR